jgi:hypothetical protein
MTKITENQLRQIIRAELNEIFGFGSAASKLKTRSPFGDKLAVLIANFNVIQDKYGSDKEVIKFGKLLQDMLVSADREAHSARFFQ